jgi:hypothetical protein
VCQKTTLQNRCTRMRARQECSRLRYGANGLIPRVSAPLVEDNNMKMDPSDEWICLSRARETSTERGAIAGHSPLRDRPRIRRRSDNILKQPGRRCAQRSGRKKWEEGGRGRDRLNVRASELVTSARANVGRFSGSLALHIYDIATETGVIIADFYELREA